MRVDMNLKTLIGFFLLVVFPMGLFAQGDNAKGKETSGEKVVFKLSGYMQGTLVVGEKYADSPVGVNTHDTQTPFMRLGIRRGYVKVSASYKGFSAVTQVRATDKAIGVYNAYLKYAPQWLPGHALSLGLCTVPFGYELGTSSRLRETFERADYYGHLFPGDVDMGLFYNFSWSNASYHVNTLTLDAGIASGNGEYGMRKAAPDAVVRLVLGHKGQQMSRLYGLSGYYGYATALGNQYARRIYLGAYFDYQFLFRHSGTLKLRSEVIGGRQAGSPKSNSAVAGNAPEKVGAESFLLVERPFIGVMGMAVFRFRHFPLESFVKYDYYQRNSRLGERLKDPRARQALHYDAEGESHQVTFGLNAYFLDDRVRLSAHYELNKARLGKYDNPFNENPILSTYWSDHDDLFLLGVQFSF